MERIHYSIAPCSLGWVLAAATERGLCAIELGDDPSTLETGLQERFPHAALVRDPDLGGWMKQIAAFLEAPQWELSLPLDMQGTAFQRRVWAALCEIPAGETISYTALAARIGAASAVRAVAAACAANRLAVAVPCHRVVRKDGELGGYRWGLERKRRLLERERRAIR
ncbi:methylated-DNA--[protein]-cysteine S-methyltransferase [Caldilinea sp.]|uniref:methylated-DNA--[protein]-cysteine S-methyltransferase n=1 Tax=Caldilinea sp. TaxID=2293560 RepID=UPI0026338B11|nr:methylated-DNA--[protein]-cysteine S-methyltransferase [uncultured Caldilinea sp.]